MSGSATDSSWARCAKVGSSCRRQRTVVASASMPGRPTPRRLAVRGSQCKVLTRSGLELTSGGIIAVRNKACGCKSRGKHLHAGMLHRRAFVALYEVLAGKPDYRRTTRDAALIGRTMPIAVTCPVICSLQPLGAADILGPVCNRNYTEVSKYLT